MLCFLLPKLYLSIAYSCHVLVFICSLYQTNILSYTEVFIYVLFFSFLLSKNIKALITSCILHCPAANRDKQSSEQIGSPFLMCLGIKNASTHE